MKWNPKDKLYVNPYGWNSHPSSRKDEVEYIRKDTLLEWAKEKLEEYKPMAKIDDARWGQCNALKQLIDKLNSM